MSRENVELIRRAYDAYSRGDREAFVELMDPDVEFESLILEAEGGAYRGHDGVREYFDKVHEVFESWRSEITEIEEIGSDSFVIESRAVASGKAGQVPVEQTFWQAAKRTHEKIVWWKFCRTRAEALEAVGLRE